MCHREVHYTRHCCGHDNPHFEYRVDCKSAQCRYSASHNIKCTSCSTTCKQWLRPAQSVVTAKMQALCFHCSVYRP
ncbi:hypothetical protein BDZ94DRAFT_629302 [Collybia nuda]|uniref:Uncharacterized protein n=1 Tax=Collybia nuda TaxID=64659 RepID=A0A9P6CEP6_9AGAR|nr:hypothetical protein BDZ94DRAFT_629302 [Collybia nuda]